MKKLLLAVLAAGVLAVSCSKDDKEENKPTPDPKPNKGADLTAISDVFKSINVIHSNLKEDAEKTPAQLLEVYNKDIKPFVAKQDKDETTIQADFANWIEHMKDNADQTAEKGKAGKLGKRFLSAKGVETCQLVKKGLIGAFQMNGANYAIMKAVMGKDKEERIAGLDEAVTYILGDKAQLDKEKMEKNDGNELAKYILKVSGSEKYNGIADRIFNNLKEAYKKADEKPAFMQLMMDINKDISTAVAFRGVHYIVEYAEKLQAEGLKDKTAHELSEGLGLCYSLRFAYNAQNHKMMLTNEQAAGFTGMDLWADDAPAQLEAKAQAVADMFGFTLADAK